MATMIIWANYFLKMLVERDKLYWLLGVCQASVSLI